MPLNPLSLVSRASFRARIAARALEDDDFRRDLAADPKSVIQSELSGLLNQEVEFPPDLQIEVHQESPSSIHFVIPPAIANHAAASAPGVGAPEPEDLLLFWERVLRPEP